MSTTGDILNHLNSGVRVPDSIAEALSPQEHAALRALEGTIASNRTWRVMSTKLLEVSQMLNAGRDSTEVVDAIVSHARSIIGADVGYISLNEEETGFTSILATAGVVTKEFRTIHMPIGSGILGIVASTNRPAWTYDHAEDPQVTHVDYVDEAVRAEGIHGILGAPIRIAGTTIGALLVGDRHPRHYTREEISALELLGSITAVALESAQVFEQQDADVAELTRSQITLSRHVQELQWLNDVDAKLLRVLVGTARLEDLAEVLTEELGTHAVLWHEDARNLVGSSDVALWHPLIHAARHKQGVSITREASIVPVEFNGRFLGAICVAKAVTDTELRVLAHASSALTAIALFNEALVGATARKVDDLVYSVALGNAGEEERVRLRQLTGIDLGQPEDLYFVGISAPQAAGRLRIEQAIEGAAAVTRHDEHYCVLLHTPGLVDAALAPLLAQEPTVCAAAVKVSEADSPKAAHDSAMSFLHSAVALGIQGQVVTESSLGTVGLILGSDSRALELLRDRTIGPLTAYDAEHGTELTATAYHFLLNGHNVASTAKAMFIHANTVRQRLERIARLLGADWDSGPRSLDIHMALRINQLSRPNQAM